MQGCFERSLISSFVLSAEKMCLAVEGIAAICSSMLASRRFHQSDSTEELKDSSHLKSTASSKPLSGNASPSIASTTLSSRSASTSFSTSFNLASGGAASMDIDTDMEELAKNTTLLDPPTLDTPPQFTTQPTELSSATTAGTAAADPLAAITDWDAFEVQLFADQLKLYALQFMPRMDGKPDDLTILVSKCKRFKSNAHPPPSPLQQSETK